MLAEWKRAAEWSADQTDAILQRKAVRRKARTVEQVAKDAESTRKSATNLKASNFVVLAAPTQPTERDILTGSGWGQQGCSSNTCYDNFMSNKAVLAYNAIDAHKQKQ